MEPSQIATGYAASNSGGSGEGAIIFDNSKTLESLQKNLGDIEEIQNKRLAMQKEAVANNQKFMTALNPDLDGIFPGDKDAILAETKRLNQMGVEHLKNGRNPQSQADLNNQQANVVALVEVSKARNKAVTAAIGILQKDKGDNYDVEFGNSQIAKTMGVPLNELAKNPAPYLNDLVRTKVPDLDLAIDELVNKTFKQPTVTSTFEKDATGNVNLQHKTTENFPLPWAKYVAQNAANMPTLSESLNKQWAKEKATYPAKAQAMIAKYSQNNNPTLADDMAKADFLEGKLLYGHYKKSDEWIPKGETQAAKMARLGYRMSMSQIQEAQNYQGDAAILSQLAKGVGGADKAFSTIRLEPFDDVVTVDGVEKAVKIPNSIVSITPTDPADPTKGFDLITSESQALVEKAKQQFVDPAGSAMGVNLSADVAKVHLPTINALRIYIGNRAADRKWAQGVDAAFRIKDAVLPDNFDYDPDKYLGSGSTPAQTNKTTTTQSGSSTTQSSGSAKITTAEFNTKWAALKKGEKLVGPDGVTYIKK